MEVNNKKRLFYLLWLFLILSGPITLLNNYPLANIFNNTASVVLFFQRLTALIAFVLLFYQVIMGAYMDKLMQIIGSRIYRLHVVQGIVAFSLVLIHPIFYTINYAFLTGKFRSFIFPNFSSTLELNINFGRYALVFLTFAVFASYFRTKYRLRRNWLKLHILNYVAFVFVSYHAFKVGSDVMSPPFVYVFWLANISVSLTILFKIYLYIGLRRNFSKPAASSS